MVRGLLIATWLLACACRGAAPSVVTPPSDIEVPAGCPATFLVTAFGDAPLAYQWWLGGELVSGATVSRYTFTTTEITAEPASYWVVVTNISGSVTSEVAYLTVTEPAAADTNIYAATTNLPNMILGGVKVSMMVRADQFLPLVLTASLAACLSGVTNDAQGLAARQVLATGKTQFTNLSDAVNGTWSNTFAFKHLDGISSGSLGYWGDEYARTNQPCCGYQAEWGIFQVPCVLVNEWFMMKPGHTGLWTGTNCLIRFIGTNGQAYFAKSRGGLDWHGLPAHGCVAPPQYIQDMNAASSDMALHMLWEAMPSEVTPAWVWPTNYTDYCSSGRTKFTWKGIHTCQQATYFVDAPTVYVSAPSIVELTFSYQTNLHKTSIPNHIGGDSGSPAFSVLGDKAVLDYESGYNGPNRRIIEAAMIHLWTNAGLPAETCPGFRVVDLSGYQKLR